MTEEFGPNVTSLSILDLGAGTGKLLLPLVSRLNHVKELSFVLVDAEEAMMNGLRDKLLSIRPDAKIETVVMDFVSFVRSREDNDDQVFDVCLSSFAMHYCPAGEPRMEVFFFFFFFFFFFNYLCIYLSFCCFGVTVDL